jgi:hypothetical protein
VQAYRRLGRPAYLAGMGAGVWNGLDDVPPRLALRRSSSSRASRRTQRAERLCDLAAGRAGGDSSARGRARHDEGGATLLVALLTGRLSR